MTKKVITLTNINSNIIEAEYAVRGPLLARATQIANELEAGSSSKPFTRVVKANIGDCHATGQKPITFIRQVLALCTYPDLLNCDMFPADTKERARRILSACRGASIGSYTESPGMLMIRKDIATFIEDRDGHPSDPDNIIMSTGATDVIRTMMTFLLTGKTGSQTAGFMIPIPQYPLYTAALSLFGAIAIPYYLNEETQWSLEIGELERALKEAKPICVPRAIVIINPGNPTGQVLSKANIEDVVRFAYNQNLFILADEVYQQTVYTQGCKFYSFKQVLMDMGPPYNQMELASFMSVSKGYMGECGLRGGYTEVINLEPAVRAQLLKTVTTKLCPPVPGQVALDCTVNPPKPGDPSYDLFKLEKETVLGHLKEKATLVTQVFNSIEGISCNEVQGAMYAFPRIVLPDKAIEAAKVANQTPDSFYCFALLEETGICTVPGSGFKEVHGTYHFRITILPPKDELKETLATFRTFHENFIAKYT